MMNNLSPQTLCNNIRKEVEGINTLNLPLDVFPQKVQEIILNLSYYENYKVEYTIATLLSAAATAIGNTYRLNVKGLWMCSPALYIILVGRAGMGKTHPIEFAYKPIREYDWKMYEQYKTAMKEYYRLMPSKKDTDTANNDAIKPTLTKTIISDFTTEAMVSVHSDNLRGITILVDEILALFKSIKRYNNNDPLVQLLLSAYSGGEIDNVRKSERMPIHIKMPCINIIGSIQTLLIGEVFRKEYTDNGFLDRFLFTYPNDSTISPWRIDSKESKFNVVDCWKGIIGKLLNEPLVISEGNIIPTILTFSDEAKVPFYAWNNSITEDVNAIKDDRLVESRKLKLSGHLARLALIIQLLRWACGESHKEYVDITSVQGGIRLMEFFETCYSKIKDTMMDNEVGSVDNVWLSLLPGEFTTAEAIVAGQQIGIGERAIYMKLNQLSTKKDSPITKTRHGFYCKRQQKQFAVHSVSSVWGQNNSDKHQETEDTANTASGKVVQLPNNDSYGTV